MKKKSNAYKPVATYILLLLTGIFYALPSQAQRHVKEYYLTIKEQKVNMTGETVRAITVNDSIPAPTLYFTEGDSAVIHIKNDMNVESSIHWHGILIPNYFDGVPYLSTPPIGPGKTFTVRFPVRQHGTYWYHSHSLFQEQRGLFGALVFYPKKETRKLDYDKETVLLLSDWTNDNPHHVMNNLKRNSEWYAIKKGSTQSLTEVIAHHGLGERIQMAWQRMPPMDISDVYYDAFLVNGKKALHFPNAKPGERIRIRVIDGSSSTFFHVQYAGGKMEMIAADGQDVQPVEVSRVLMGVAETYDFIITVPEGGAYEFRATAQDGTGYTSVWFGKGEPHAAPALPKPDLFHLMGIQMYGMGGMQMKGMNLSERTMKKEMPYIKKAYIEREDVILAGSMSMNMPGMNMKGMNMNSDTSRQEMNMDNMKGMDMKDMNMNSDTSHPEMNMRNMNMNNMKGMNMNSDTSKPGMKGMNMDMNMKGMKMKGMPASPSGRKMNPDTSKPGMKGMNMENMKGMDMKGMDMNSDTSHPGMKGMTMDNMKGMDMNSKPKTQNSKDTSHPGMKGMKMDDMKSMDMSGMNMDQGSNGDTVIFNYDMLKAMHPTNYDTTEHTVRHLTFNLTGSMWRYIWSINGKTLSEKDSILIKKGEILYITMNNKTMMYHPMHLHGHFFRVLNANGKYSPLKHTVTVPPMRSVTIEFLADEPGNWFFHCHLLYHMMAGMARSFQYKYFVPRDTMKNFSMSKLFNDDNHWFFWGNTTIASNRAEGYLSYSNRKNWVQAKGNYGWRNREYEFEGTYERFVTKYLRPYIGAVVSNKPEYMDYFKDHQMTVPGNDIRGVAGVRYLLPFFLTADLRIDTRGHVRFGLNGETWVLPRFWLTYSWNTDMEYEANLEYRLSQYFSLSAGYNSDYKWGGGLLVWF